MNKGRKFILLVDDNADDEMLTMDALRSGTAEREVFVVRDGAEALDWLFSEGMYADRDSTAMPDMVLLDLKLPKVNGLEVLLRMRSQPATRYVPTIVLSSSTQPEDIASSYRNGANSYVRKAMNFDDYTDALRCLCKYWLQHNLTTGQALAPR